MNSVCGRLQKGMHKIPEFRHRTGSRPYYEDCLVFRPGGITDTVVGLTRHSKAYA